MGIAGLSVPAHAEIHLSPANATVQLQNDRQSGDFIVNANHIVLESVTDSSTLSTAPLSVGGLQSQLLQDEQLPLKPVLRETQPLKAWTTAINAPSAQPVWTSYKQGRVAVTFDMKPLTTQAPFVQPVPRNLREASDMGMANLGLLLIGKNAQAQQLKALGSAITALDVSLDITRDTFKGTMVGENSPELTVAENLLVARAESGFRSVVSAPAPAFRNPVNRVNRPAGLYQIGAIEFGSALAQHKSDLKLSPELNRSFSPVFLAIDTIAQQYANRTHRDVQTVLSQPSQFGQAFKQAAPELQEIVRHARVDATPIEVKGRTTTKGSLLSTIAKLYIADSAMKAPDSLVKRYGAAVLRYTEHVFGRGGALAITGVNPGAVSTRWLTKAMRANPFARTRSMVLENIRVKKFGMLDQVASVLSDAMSGSLSGALPRFPTLSL